ncbi:hypothetical protein MAR_036684 [Mya arenaria]|uniref:Uncharacterized protein n=1 Tax=Mya arenaria TaxID=6604 RepID=A0ABY7FLE5_MYAAR|nr:hypothetical protein MAR_036684 [Mya arenaria]
MNADVKQYHGNMAYEGSSNNLRRQHQIPFLNNIQKGFFFLRRAHKNISKQQFCHWIEENQRRNFKISAKSEHCKNDSPSANLATNEGSYEIPQLKMVSPSSAFSAPSPEAAVVSVLPSACCLASNVAAACCQFRKAMTPLSCTSFRPLAVTTSPPLLTMINFGTAVTLYFIFNSLNQRRIIVWKSKPTPVFDHKVLLHFISGSVEAEEDHLKVGLTVQELIIEIAQKRGELLAGWTPPG